MCLANEEGFDMNDCTAVIERDPDTGLFVGYAPGWPGAHSQGATIDELESKLREVIRVQFPVHAEHESA